MDTPHQPFWNWCSNNCHQCIESDKATIELWLYHLILSKHLSGLSKHSRYVSCFFSAEVHVFCFFVLLFCIFCCLSVWLSSSTSFSHALPPPWCVSPVPCFPCMLCVFSLRPPLSLCQFVSAPCCLCSNLSSKFCLTVSWSYFWFSVLHFA